VPEPRGRRGRHPPGGAGMRVACPTLHLPGSCRAEHPSLQEGRTMDSLKTCLAGVGLWLPLLLTASADEGGKLIERKPPGREPTNDKEFLVWAVACEVAECKSAEKAAKNANDPDVKKMAQKVLDDHKKLRDSLLEQAKKMRIAVVEGLEKHH